MNEKIRVLPVAVESKHDEKAPRTGYTAPWIVAGGSTVELLQGIPFNEIREMGGWTAKHVG
jgi:hypothetical protein